MVDMTLKGNRVKSLKRAQVKRALAEAAKKGRGGDDRIVHVNALEEAMLKAAGGAGTINPATGLREYAAGGAANRSEGGLGPTGAGPGTGGGRGANGGNAGSKDWKNPTPGKSLNRKPPNMRSTPNPTIGAPLTMDNALRLGGTIASTLAGPVGTATALAGTALDAALNGTAIDPMSPFDGPFTKEMGFDYDPSNRFGTPNARSGKTSGTKRITSKPKKGFTLLGGMPGTMLGS
jgi:hypothetical protein